MCTTYSYYVQDQSNINLLPEMLIYRSFKRETNQMDDYAVIVYHAHYWHAIYELACYLYVRTDKS